MKHQSARVSSQPDLRANRKFQLALAVLPVGLMFASFVPGWFFAMALAHALGIPDDAPVRDQPNGLLWIVLFFATMLALFCVGPCLGFTLNALILRFAFGWSWARIRDADACPNVLVASLESTMARRTKGEPLNGGRDPMHDPQLDDAVESPPGRRTL